MGVLKPELIMKSVVPVVMAGILGIYGMIVAVIIVQKSTDMSDLVPSNPANYSYYQGYAHLASGLCCGFSSLVSVGISSGSGTVDRNCRRCRCTRERSTGQDLRGNDSNPDLR